MKKTGFIILVSFILGISCILISYAASKMEIWFQLDKDKGPSKMIVTCNVEPEKAWLGRSIYPKGCINPATEGNHEIIEVKKGLSLKTWGIDPKFYNGTYEVALWGKKVDKANCKIPGCESCKLRGYHLEQILLYKSGDILSLKK